MGSSGQIAERLPICCPGQYITAQRLRRWWKVLALFSILWLIGNLSFAKPHMFEQMEHRRWIAADDGPSQVGAIAQTTDGYLWLGTNESLFRFDGFRFIRYEAPDRNTLNIVASLLATENELWVGLRFGGIRMIRSDRTLQSPVGPFPDGVVYGIARDRQNGIWIAADDGLARFDGSHWQLVSDNWGFPGNKARAVFVDRNGVLWAASDHRLLYLPDGARRFVDSGLEVNWVSQIAQAPDDSIWITERYNGKLHRVVMDDGKASVKSVNMNTPSMGMIFDRNGRLWIGTTGQGVIYVDDPTDLESLAYRHFFTAKDGLSSNFVWKMFEDNEGNIWVGTNAGLDRFRSKTLMPAGFPAGALNFALAADSNGGLWAGPSNRPAMRLADGKLVEQRMQAPVNCAIRDADGTVWMGGPSGIWRSDHGKLSLFSPLPHTSLSESPVRAMARDTQGTLWVSINRIGLYKLQDGAWTLTPPVSDTPNQRMPVTASADPQGRVWFGYRDNLLVMRDAAQERRWTSANGLDIGHVTAIAHHRDRTWVGGQRGLGFIEGNNFHSIRLPDNGLFRNVYAILPVPLQSGHEDDVWIQSKSGIFQLTASELKLAFNDPNYQIRYRSYDLMGGLANDPYQVLPLPTAVRSDDGRLWFSTSNGVVWIDPQRLSPQEAGPTVVIESVSVDGVRLPSTSPVTLEAKTQRIVIDYTALSLSAPERLNFRYRLEGYDNDWNDAGRQREATYTRLSAGNYRFRVIAYNKDGSPSAQEGVFVFNIPQVFYLRPFFLFLVAIVTAGILWILYQINLRRAAEHLRERLEERHNERERIARELHDTLLQGFHGLTLRFQAVADNIPSEHPARRQMESALDRADQVLNEGRDKVRDLRSDTLDIGELQDNLTIFGNELEKSQEARLRLRVRGELIPLNAVVRDEIHYIAREAILNAFSHAKSRYVDVQIEYGLNVFSLMVKDDGLGIDHEYLASRGRPGHWGLRGMHERAENIGAKLVIESTPKEGSKITVSIPAVLAYRFGRRRLLSWRSIWLKTGS